MPDTDLIAGDRVRVTADQETWKNLQQGYGDWDDLMAEVKTIGHTVQYVHVVLLSL